MSELPEEIINPMDRVPPGERPFKIDAKMMRGLNVAQQSQIWEEKIARESRLRVVAHCSTNEEHNKKPCANCWDAKLKMSTGMRYNPETEKLETCTFCEGTRMVPQGGSPIVWGCKHILQAPKDKYHPGIVFTPKRYYVCRDCFKLVESHRFHFGTEIVANCWHCINELSHILHAIDPAKIRDLCEEQN